MKRLIAGLYLLFGLLLAGTIAVAVRSYDGPVEEQYSLRGERFLEERERGEEIGLRIRVPDRIETGDNRFRTRLSTSDGPLRNASVTIRAMRIRGPGEDREVPLREAEPGVYAGELRIPTPGTWMMRLAIRSGTIDTVRSWTVSAGAPSNDPAGIPPENGAGPVALPAGTRSDVAR